ncbi:hypothetical protein CONLIGDRAFT_648290 [Coniochaeta ligniaria NRRL 30616]|uniref:Methyltransferase n=1 Tax=Coniochaeta ligniaria NRRL 30616 TaxID=1408157 RepID=A0A1J7JCC2_9PEZI|nr:hypothetical protein CONLIGDRAFT_648290 [Coniochaeta ligniaria NRRL 30616]
MTNDELVKLTYATRLPIHAIEKPYQMISSFPGTYKKSNIEFNSAPEPERIRDLRGQEHKYSLNSHGFQVIEHHSDIADWSDKQAIENQYLPQVQQLFTSHLDEVDEVKIFNWRKRKNRMYKDEGIQEVDLEDGSHYVLPAAFVHIDHSPAAVLQLVQFHMGERAAQLLRGRVRVVNFWKPICPYPIQDAPLALCDGTSVADTDFMAADHVRRNYTGETLLLLHRPGFRWHYLSNQVEHEGYLIKIFDSLPGVQAKHCPHTSFQHRAIPSGCPARESIEVRALVFTHVRDE